jgi:hypothetical protein
MAAGQSTPGRSRASSSPTSPVGTLASSPDVGWHQPAHCIMRPTSVTRVFVDA